MLQAKDRADFYMSNTSVFSTVADWQANRNGRRLFDVLTEDQRNQVYRHFVGRLPYAEMVSLLSSFGIVNFS